MLDKRSLLEAPEKIEPLHGEVTAANIGLVDDDGILLLEGVNFDFSLGTDIAIVGHTDLNSVPLAVSGRRIGYVGPITYLFSASVRDNLLLGLRHRPNRVPDDGSAGEPSRTRAIEEARQPGTIDYDMAAYWIDYPRAGVANRAELELRMIEVLRLVDLEEDVHLFGLR